MITTYCIGIAQQDKNSLQLEFYWLL